MTLQLPRLSIVTLNCAGLRNDVKRRKLFHQLRTSQADIICLQETHCRDQDAAYWTNMWAGPAVWTSHVAVLLARPHSLVRSSVRFDNRLLLVDVTVRGHTFQVVNLYAPADPPPRLSLFKSLSDHPSLFDPSSVAFWAGDWNCCPDPADREPIRTASDHWIHLAPSLVDYFDAALQGATRRYFTFHHNNGQTRARLDHVFA